LIGFPTVPVRPKNLHAIAIRNALSASLFLLMCLGFSTQAKSSDGPQGPVQLLHDKLILGMKVAPNVGIDGRYLELAKPLKEAFNFEWISRFILGRYWKQLNDVEKKKITKKISNLFIYHYAFLTNGYFDEELKIVDKESEIRRIGEAKITSVETTIVLLHRPPITLNYRVRKKNESAKWKIIDINFSSNISALVNYRTSAAYILRRHGLEKFISLIDIQISRWKNWNESN
jgi:ABC-type transporter MlaC component